MESGSGGANRKHPIHQDITIPKKEQRFSQVRGSNEVAFINAAKIPLFLYIKRK